MLPVINRTLPSFVDDIFGKDLFDDFAVRNTHRSMPKVNIIEGKDEFRIELAAPGLSKEDYRVDLDNDVLTISSEKEEKNEANEEKTLRREFSYCSFKRSFSLPESVDGEKVKAEYKNGVLNVYIPKKEEAKIKPARAIKIG